MILMSHEQGAYHYVPSQGATSFRLVEVLPGKSTRPLRIRLLSSDWTIAPKYEAISYVWGDSNDTVEVAVEDWKVKITRSLSTALVAFRLQSRSRIVWADAICIDQTNKTERGFQVTNMGNIFKNASEVLVWLGDEFNDTDCAIETLETVASKLSGLARTLKVQRAHQHEVLEKVYEAYPESELEIDQVIECNWADVKAFLSKPWFTRLWVVQEANSGPSVTLFCGSKKIDWHIVSIAAFIIGDFQRRLLSDSALAPAFLRKFDYKGSVNVVDVLHWARHLQSSDPRDKVYGLLGLINISLGEFRISANYNKPKTAIFQDATEAIINKTNNLQILAHVQANDKLEIELPSWVPRWDEELQFCVLHHTAYGAKADGLQSAVLRLDSNLGNLTVWGIRVDSITVVHKMDAEGLFPTSQSANLATEEYRSAFWKRVGSTVARKSLSNRELFLTYAVTIATGLRYSGPGLQSGRADRIDLLANFMEYLKIYAPDLGIPEDIICNQAGRVLPQNLRKFLSLANRYCLNRSVFVTTNGYIGLGAKVLRPQDLLCVLFGNTCPSILRPRLDTRYEVIGCAFVDGLMDGEIVEMWKTSTEPTKVQSENFVLC